MFGDAGARSDTLPQPQIRPGVPRNESAESSVIASRGRNLSLGFIVQTGRDRRSWWRLRFALGVDLPKDVRIRRDGRVLHDVMLWRVKAPAESNGAQYLFAILQTLPGNQVFRPENEGDCPLNK
jgi:hypothetical protein